MTTLGGVIPNPPRSSAWSSPSPITGSATRRNWPGVISGRVPRPRNGAGNWGVSLCLFVPTKKPTNLGKCSCGTAGRTDLAVLLFLFVPAKNRRYSSTLLIRLGVPDGI